jgi:3,4-dihydroxy 2-butanone 4-phosphate synthase/GTP cyclohydrolase II
MTKIAEQGRGVIVLLREASSSSLSELVNQQARKSPDSQSAELRDYGVGAQILTDLNITNMILLTNSKPNVIGLEGYGLHIDGWEPVTDTEAKDKG